MGGFAYVESGYLNTIKFAFDRDCIFFGGKDEGVEEVGARKRNSEVSWGLTQNLVHLDKNTEQQQYDVEMYIEIMVVRDN